MTTPPPRRTRRRQPGGTLARPAAAPGDAAPTPSHTAAPRLGSRVHHVTKDYGYVRTDLLGIAAAGAVVIGFITVMAIITS